MAQIAKIKFDISFFIISAGRPDTIMDSSTYAYMATSHPPTAVRCACVGSFTRTAAADGEDWLADLVIAKGHKLEVHAISSEGLEPVFEVGLYGHITHMQLLPQAAKPGSPHMLAVLTQRMQLAFLVYDADSAAITTLATGDVSDVVGAVLEQGALLATSTEHNCLALHMYTSVVKIVPIGNAFNDQAYNVRLNELLVLDMVFVPGTAEPCLAVLAQAADGSRYIRSYRLDTDAQVLQPGPWEQQAVDASASVLVPCTAVEGGAVLAVGCETSCLLSSHGTQETAHPAWQPSTWCAVRGCADRALVAGSAGELRAFQWQESGALSSVSCGSGSAAAAVAHVVDGIVFVGSACDDSLLLSVQNLCALGEFGPAASALESQELERFPSLAPIMDMSLIESKVGATNSIVAACGAFTGGSLKVIKHGVSVMVQAEIELDGARSVWTLSATDADDPLAPATTSHVVLSTLDSSMVLSVADDEITEIEPEALALDVGTVAMGMCHGYAVQVTAREVRACLLASDGSMAHAASWAPADGDARITAAAVYSAGVALSFGGGRLQLLTLAADGSVFQASSTIQLANDVSCLSAHVQGDTALLLAGQWTSQAVQIFTLPALEQVASLAVPGHVQASAARVLMRTPQEGHLVVGTAEGMLFYYPLHLAATNQRDLVDAGAVQKFHVGTRAVELHHLAVQGKASIFVACDSPCVLHYANDTIACTAVNIPATRAVASFHTAAFPGCLAYVGGDTLTLGVLDSAQRIKIHSQQLAEQPRAVAHHEASSTVACATVGRVLDPATSSESASVRLYDVDTLAELHSIALDAFEQPQCIASIMLTQHTAGDSAENRGLAATPVPGAEAEEYLAVGTAYVLEGEEEPSKGRILVFAVTPGADAAQAHSLQLVAASAVDGGVFAITSCAGGVVAGVNGDVQLRWLCRTDAGAADAAQSAGVSSPIANATLEVCAQYSGAITVLTLHNRGNFVLVGDLMKSLALLIWRPDTRTFEECAADPAVQWTTAASFLNDDVFLLADANYNLTLLSRPLDSESAIDRARLSTLTEFNLGEQVNAIQSGTMVPAMAQPAAMPAAAQRAAGNVTKRVRTDQGAVDTLPDKTAPASASLMLATVSGSLYTFFTLTHEQYQFLHRLQHAILAHMPSVGGFPYEQWRTYWITSTPAYQLTSSEDGACDLIVDGDVLEQFLDYSADIQTAIVDRMKTSAPPTGCHPETSLSPSGSAVAASMGDIVSFLQRCARRH